MIGGGYGEREIFTAEEVKLYRLAEALVGVCPYLEPDNVEAVRCHELARAVAAMISRSHLYVFVVDGSYGAIEHSWITLGKKDPKRHWASPTILDVYVPGALPQVQLIDTSSAIPLNHRPGAIREDVREDVVDYLAKVMRR